MPVSGDCTPSFTAPNLSAYAGILKVHKEQDDLRGARKRKDNTKQQSFLPGFIGQAIDNDPSHWQAATLAPTLPPAGSHLQYRGKGLKTGLRVVGGLGGCEEATREWMLSADGECASRAVPSSKVSQVCCGDVAT